MTVWAGVNQAKFGSGDVKFLFCHVILRDHLIKGSWDFMGGSPLR